MNTSYIRSRWLMLFAVVVFSLSAPAQDKPRVFMAGHGTTNGMTNGSAGGTRSGGAWWAGGRTDSIVDSHDESMELAKNFASNCPGVQVTVNPDTADYVTSLNRESKAKKGVFSKNDQIQVSNKAGDVLLASTVRSVATAAKDACNLILSDFAAHGHAKPVSGTTPVALSQLSASLQGTPMPQNDVSSELDISSTPQNADIEIDGSFVGNTPSSLALVGGEHAVRITKSGYKPWERKVKTSKGTARIVAELETAPSGYVAALPAPQKVEADRPIPAAVNTTMPDVPVPARTVETAKIESKTMVEPSGMKVAAEKAQSPTQLQVKERSGEPSICASLGLKTENTDIAGAKISEIAKGGVADHGGLHVGDVINSVDGKAVRGPGELEAELQNRAPGTNIRVGYMFRSSALGYFSKEVVLPLPPR